MDQNIIVQKETKRGLVLGDYGQHVHTGFATVLNNLIKWIKILYGNTEDVGNILFDIVAINNFGIKDSEGKTKTFYREDKWTNVMSALFSTPLVSTPEAKDDFGRHGFLWILQHSNDPETDEEEKEKYSPLKGYDFIFINQDAPVINEIVPVLEKIRRENKEKNLKNFKSIFYFPCDFPMVDQVIDKLGFFDLLITYNEYSRDAILKLRPEFKNKLKVVNHGIDLTNLFPIEDKSIVQKFRREYFGNNADKFIVLNLNRNQPRKDVPATIFGFKEFKKNNPDAFLYLHMNPVDPKGWDLRMVMVQLDLIEGIDFMFPPAEKQNHGHSVEEINLIYNACDVYVTTTKGEGWGLGVTEAMGCGIPVICPMHTSFLEISDNGKRVYPLENLYPLCTIDDNIVRDQCDYIEVAEKLQEVKDDMKKESPVLKNKLELALEYVKKLSWKNIGQKFVKLFKETI